jgi:hypothetical protein
VAPTRGGTGQRRDATRAAVVAPTSLTIRDELLLLRADELDRLVEALGALGGNHAGAVAEQIMALRLAGGSIRLMPTEAEIAAMGSALALADEGRPVGSELLRLSSVCRFRRDLPAWTPGKGEPACKADV